MSCSLPCLIVVSVVEILLSILSAKFQFERKTNTHKALTDHLALLIHHHADINEHLMDIDHLLLNFDDASFAFSNQRVMMNSLLLQSLVLVIPRVFQQRLSFALRSSNIAQSTNERTNERASELTALVFSSGIEFPCRSTPDPQFSTNPHVHACMHARAQTCVTSCKRCSHV